VWKPGSGRDIRIGVDPMVGSHSFYKLSENIFLLLKEQGIEFLANAGTNVHEGFSFTRWKKAESLGWEGVLKYEWTNYTRGLVSVGIDLNAEKDRLLWSWDTKKRQVNAKQDYKVQVMEGREEEPKFWYLEICE
jgi:hypothetical protein